MADTGRHEKAEVHDILLFRYVVSHSETCNLALVLLAFGFFAIGLYPMGLDPMGLDPLDFDRKGLGAKGLDP